MFGKIKISFLDFITCNIFGFQACAGPPMSSSSTTSSEDSFMEENLFMNDMNEFNMAAEKFSGQCILFVRKHRYYLGNNFEKYYNQLEALLKCLHILHCLKWRTRGDIVLRYSSSHVLTNFDSTNLQKNPCFVFLRSRSFRLRRYDRLTKDNLQSLGVFSY